ncbi:reverse transcriptase domain-containing protein, partial [Tanacetum coccineum]
QFLHDKPTEDDQEKSKVRGESDSTLPDPSHQIVTSTPPVIAPFIDVLSSKPSLLLRVAKLEQEMSEEQNLMMLSLRFQVPTADLIEKHYVLPGPESVKNQESKKSPKEIIKAKKEQGRRTRFYLHHQVTDEVDNETDDERHDKEVADKVKDHKRKLDSDDDDEDDDDRCCSPSAGSNQDGSSCIDGSGVGLILTNPEGVEFTYAMRFRFEATNNEAEYEALIAGLRITEQMGVKNLQANLLSPCIKLVPRSENKKADALSKIASTSFAHLSKQVLVEELKEKSIHEKEVLAIVEEEWQTWMTPICEYLTKEILPEDKKKARVRYEGSYSMHSGPRSVVANAIRTGYYWPTMHTDARKLIRECNDCQVHRPIPRNPQQNLTPITSPWPFYKWGIDIAGPFPEGPGKVKFLIVVIDYFTKWIEAKPVTTITGNQVKKFVWDNIVCRFGLPREIVSNNGKQFRDNPFKDWSLGEGIKARLDERSKDCIGELSHVLWAHRTMIKSSNGETPFSLTYGKEAVIPADIGMPTLRTAEVDLTKNDEALEINLDLIEEKREQAAIQEAKSKAKMEKYYNSKV